MSAERWSSAATLAFEIDKTPEAERRAIGLAIDLRTMGLERTLQWLHYKEGGAPIRAALLREIGLAGADPTALRTMPRLALLRAHHDAFAFAEALHLVVKAGKNDKGGTP